MGRVEDRLKRAFEKESHVAAGMDIKPLAEVLAGERENIDLQDAVLQNGVVIEIDLTTHEADVPDGRTLPDRNGYFYSPTGDPIQDKFSMPMFTLSEWRDSYAWDELKTGSREAPQLLVNTNWFNIWDSGIPQVGQKMNLRKTTRTFMAGLAISDGTVISSHHDLDQGDIPLDAIIIDNNHSSAMILDNKDVDAYLSQNQDNLSHVSAASGFVIRRDGLTQKTPDVNNNHFKAVPRAGIGLSNDGKKLYMVTIQTSDRASGITVEDFSKVFGLLGCDTAINLDNFGSVELLYDGPDDMGRQQRFQTITCDVVDVVDKNKVKQKKHDTERPKPGVMAFSHKNPKTGYTQDDMFLPNSRTKDYDLKPRSLDDQFLGDPSELRHDSYFNEREKVQKETKMAIDFMADTTCVEKPCKKVSQMLVDIFISVKEAIEKDPEGNSLNHRFVDFMMNAQVDLHVIYGAPNIDKVALLNAMIEDLKAPSMNEDVFYRHMCISRAFIAFIAGKGKLTKEGIEAKNEGWLNEQMFFVEDFERDMVAYRGDLFVKNKRLDRKTMADTVEGEISSRVNKPSIFKKYTTKMGVLAPEDEAKQTEKSPLYLHRPGKSDFMITTQGDFVAEGMHELGMPQLCGPSGMTAMRMALANQGGLDDAEMQGYHYASSMYHVAIGAHTVDECFAIGQGQAWNTYERGNYDSIQKPGSEQRRFSR